jgi:hypothetical protein
LDHGSRQVGCACNAALPSQCTGPA